MAATSAAKMAADKLFSVAGKTVLVTGGGRGIGAMIAKVRSEVLAWRGVHEGVAEIEPPPHTVLCCRRLLRTMRKCTSHLDR